MKNLVGRIASACRNAVQGVEERISSMRGRKRKRATRARYARLGLMALEDRLAPATYTWTGAGVNDSVHTAAN